MLRQDELLGADPVGRLTRRVRFLLGQPALLARGRGLAIGRSTSVLRLAAIGATVVILGLGVALFYAEATRRSGSFVATDIHQYLRATLRWIETGTPYLASDVTGHVTHGPDTFLHPPVSLYLFAPFLVLPLVLWWVIPICIVVASVASWRPAWWAWPLLALALAWPRFHGALLVGNTDLWVWAGFALGLRLGWPALIVVAKPSLVVLALAGIHHRSWWVGTVVVAIACAPFGFLWVDWFRVMLNGPGDWTYSLPNLVWVAMPAIAWAARRRPPVSMVPVSDRPAQGEPARGIWRSGFRDRRAQPAAATSDGRTVRAPSS